eukprot:CAMPEP_0198263872 /NCGR_PEP_ID=MMETSP1447-20131203/13843_1 /TAXON_ID=420782 /ORGANISM="Chaetoceros dichaeta, Strain CCMP1751" /LENGTH=666 /DNA_ID=CAMNT_0043952625 /DNA_START=79 /DNA_END=2079 /DNA_ORIENTATION=-
MGSDVGEPVPRSAPADFDGPAANGKRSTTDIIGTILFTVMSISLSVIGFTAASMSDGIDVLFSPMDYDGNLCGSKFKDKADMTDFPSLVFVNTLGGGVCVKKCPEFEDLVDVRTLLTFNGVYQEDGDMNVTLKDDYVSVANYSKAKRLMICNPTTCPTDPKISWNSTGINMDEGFATYAVSTFEIVKHRCLADPRALREITKQVADTTEDTITNQILDKAGIGNFINHLYADLFVARYYIFLIGFLLSMFIGLVYTQLLRLPGVVGLMVWGSIFGTFAILIGTGVFIYQQAVKWDEEEPQVTENNTIKWTKGLAYFLWIIAGLAFLVLLFLRKSIMLAIAVMKQAARAIGAMPVITFFPLGQGFLTAAAIILWMYYAISLAAVGDIEFTDIPGTELQRPVYNFSKFQERAGWYFIFCLFWIVEYMKASTQLVIALCVSKWYFTRDKSKIGTTTFTSSYWTCLRYHSGTAAIGSLLVAIVRLIRAMVAYVQKKAKGFDNKIGQAILCCCQCCLWCFEKLLRFINKNAYIQTAIFGTSFCTSAKEAFFLILRNARRVASLSYVSALLIFVGRVFIAILTTCAAYIIISSYVDQAEIHSPVGPAALVFLIALVVGDMFLDLFEMATETILQCFIADEEMFDGDGGYADGDLRKWFDDHEKKEKEIMGSS